MTGDCNCDLVLVTSSTNAEDVRENSRSRLVYTSLLPLPSSARGLVTLGTRRWPSELLGLK